MEQTGKEGVLGSEVRTDELGQESGGEWLGR